MSTWRDGTNGHCIMETDCPDTEDLSVYEFGLLCSGEGGEVTRHVFGQDSFLHHETFDTLIVCQDCLALDEYMDAGAAIKNLAEQVDTLKQGMSSVTSSITKLEVAVGGPAPAPAPAPAAVAPATFVAQRRPGRHPAQHPSTAKRAAGRGRSSHQTGAAKSRSAQRLIPARRTLAHQFSEHKAIKVQHHEHDVTEGESEDAVEGDESQQLNVKSNIIEKRRRHKDTDAQAITQDDQTDARDDAREDEDNDDQYQASNKDRSYFAEENVGEDSTDDQEQLEDGDSDSGDEDA